jgi:hypothetical protein
MALTTGHPAGSAAIYLALLLPTHFHGLRLYTSSIKIAGDEKADGTMLIRGISRSESFLS